MEKTCPGETPRGARRWRGIGLRVCLVAVIALSASLPAGAQQNLDQFHYRWRNDDGSEDAATFAASQDTKLTGLAKNTLKRLRFEVSNEGTVGSGPTAYQLQFAESTSCASGASAAGTRTLAAGADHTCVRLASGQVQCWGRNVEGQIGDGTTTSPRLTAVTVSGITDASQVTAGEYHTCASFPSGAPKCWGVNWFGEVGDGTTTQRLVPTAVTGIANATQVTAGSYDACSRLPDGGLRCWGINNYGQLGDGTSGTNRWTPVPVSGVTDAVQATTGHYHTCTLRATGSVRCWGYNAAGQIGDGTTTDRWTPVVVAGLSSTVGVSAGGYHTCALSSAGTATCWGRNVEGQIGDGTSGTNRWAPVAVSGLTGAVQIAAGGYHTCALLGSGSISCWGDNSSGQLGDGTTTPRTTPVPVSGISNAVEVAAGHNHTCAVLATGQIACWGANWSGQLGDGTTTSPRLTPVTWVPSSPPTMPYRPVPTDTSGHWQIADSSYFTDASATTDNPGLTNESATFVPGQIKDAGNTTGSITLGVNTFTELEFALRATANSTSGGNYCFRLYDITNNKVLDTYAAYAQAQLTSPTAVTLVSFTAAGRDREVVLEWVTASELDNLGFQLYRGSSADGPWQRLNASLIPGLGSSPEGRRYSWTDAGLANGTTYFYRLEDVDRRGDVTSHGPVSATPQAGGAPGEGGGGSSGGGSGSGSGSGSGGIPANAITHGNPQALSLRVIERSDKGLTLELWTGGFYSVPQADGTSKLLVPGFFDHSEPGLPTVPTRRLWMDARVGRAVKLAWVRTGEEESFSGLNAPVAGQPLAVATAQGTYEAGSLPVKRARRGLGLFPDAAAAVRQTAFQGERKKAYVELSPLRVDAASGTVTLAKRLLVRLEFAGRVAGETGQGDEGRRLPRALRDPGLRLARLVTHQRGLHAVAWEDLPGLSGPLATSSLRLSRLGSSVAFHVEPRTGSFGPGSLLYFVGEGTRDAYGNEAVYELAVAAGAIQMKVDVRAARRAVSSGRVPYLRSERGFEEDANYLPSLVEAKDLWFWDYGLSAAQAKDYAFTLERPLLVPETARLTVELQGGSDTEVAPDHHVRAYVNGSLVGETRFDGMVPQTLALEVPTSLLREGENSLRLENVGDTGSAFPFVYLDRFTVDYPREAAFTSGVLEGKAPQSGRVSVAAAPGTVLLDVTSKTPVWLGRAMGLGRLVWNAQAERRYLALLPEGLLRPEVRAVSPTTLRSGENRADWIVIAPEALLGAALPLVARREGQGLVSMAVSLEDVVSEFGSGESSPQAVRDFLAYAFHNWTKPSPRYVLLLGDASYDPKGHLAGTSRPDLLPTPMVRSTFLWTASDPVYASVNGDDLIPDLAVGRITAATVEEAQAAVQKVLDFEGSGQTLDGKAVLVADNPDSAGNFEADLDQIGSLLASRAVEKIYLTQQGSAAAAKAAVLSAFDSGASLMSYSGHGSAGVWASEGILRSPDVASLSPQPAQPFLLTMTCSNGYFLSPWLNSLTERLVLAGDRGAIAAFSPSGLSYNDAAHAFHTAIVLELAQGNHQRIGDVVLAAQEDYAATGAFPELLSIYHLFGDPALTIR